MLVKLDSGEMTVAIGVPVTAIRILATKQQVSANIVYGLTGEVTVKDSVQSNVSTVIATNILVIARTAQMVIGVVNACILVQKTVHLNSVVYTDAAIDVWTGFGVRTVPSHAVLIVLHVPFIAERVASVSRLFGEKTVKGPVLLAVRNAI